MGLSVHRYVRRLARMLELAMGKFDDEGLGTGRSMHWLLVWDQRGR